MSINLHTPSLIKICNSFPSDQLIAHKTSNCLSTKENYGRLFFLGFLCMMFDIKTTSTGFQNYHICEEKEGGQKIDKWHCCALLESICLYEWCQRMMIMTTSSNMHTSSTLSRLNSPLKQHTFGSLINDQQIICFFNLFYYLR